MADHNKPPFSVRIVQKQGCIVRAQGFLTQIVAADGPEDDKVLCED